MTQHRFSYPMSSVPADSLPSSLPACGARRQFIARGAAALGASLCAPLLAGATAPAGAGNTSRLPRLVLAGPYASVSNPLIRIVEEGLLSDVAEVVEFRAWKDPDQLRALALKGEADFIAMPTNVAANLFNRGVRLGLLNVSVWGLLFIVSRDGQRRTLEDFRGEELVMPFRGDMPELVLRLLADRLKIPVAMDSHGGAQDIRLRYAPTPLDAMQLLLTRRADHALLAEPAVSVGLRKSRTLPVSAISPTLHRAVDLQAEWGRAWQTQPRIPQAGVVAMGAHLDNAALLQRFAQAHVQAQVWCNTQAQACGELVAGKVAMLTPEGVADAVQAVPLESVPAATARPDLEFFFRQLHAHQSSLIGGQLPAADFYLDVPLG